MRLPAWFKQQGFWNLPNTITVARCFAVPIMVALLWREPDATWAPIACGVFVVAMVSDVVDGWLARRWNLQSVWGAFLDPLADKLMVVATLVMLVPYGWVSPWLVVLLEARELAVQGMRTLAAAEGLVIAASSLGKFKTAYQSTAIGFLLWHHELYGVDAHSVGTLLLWISAAFSVISGLEYAWAFHRHLSGR